MWQEGYSETYINAVIPDLFTYFLGQITDIRDLTYAWEQALRDIFLLEVKELVDILLYSLKEAINLYTV